MTLTTAGGARSVSLRPDRLARVAIAVLAFVAVLAGTPGTAAAVPPPPNPGDSQLDAAADDANNKAGTVDALAAKLAWAQDQLNQLHQQLELTLEQANKAMVDLQSAQGAAAAANAAETDAQRAVRDADTAVLEADKQGTLFAVGSFQQGSTIGNFSAYLASTSPEDLLDRVALLNAVGGSKLDVMSTVADAQERSVEANTAARATKERADAVRPSEQLETQRDRALYDYDAARQNATGLQVQRVAFDQWVAQRRASQAASDKAAAETARSQVLAVGSLLSTVPTSANAQAVIKRAVSQLGVPYAWDGGNSAGATQGIRDGGTADSYGDFAKVGFDCSGLMMYAFAAAGVPLPHYAGYQYLVGKQVPLSELQPGDMVFYSPSGIHHVALYIGGGMMIEAPESGSYVSVTPLRLQDIMPNAARVV